MPLFWADPWLYITALGLAAGLSLLFYLIRMWRLAFETEERAHAMALSTDVEEAVVELKAATMELQEEERAAVGEPALPPREEPKPKEAPKPRPSAEAVAAINAATEPRSRPKEGEGAPPSELLNHLDAVGQQIRDLQYLLQGLENKRAEELHDIQRRLKDIEDKLGKSEPDKPHGQAFPV